VRNFLRDTPELNRLVAGVESSDRDIASAMLVVLSEFNSEPPPLRLHTFEDFLQRGWVYPLIKGVVAYLLRSVCLLQTRNELSYSDGGVSVSTSNHGPTLMGYAERYSAEWADWTKKTKISLNIQNALGHSGASSVYATINGLDEYLETLP
jgi:hypothetical protein